MTAYTVKFYYGEDSLEYTNPNSPEDRTKETHPEILKELAGMMIQAYHSTHPSVKEQYPLRVQLFRGEECILKCDDLTENSTNQVK